MSYKPVKAKRHTPPYLIHRYFARRPWNVFEELIKTYTDKNDIILDPMMGGGVSIYEGLKNKRRVIGCDLNPLSTFIVNNMVKNDVDLKKLEAAAYGIIRYLNILYGESNTVKCECGHETNIDWFEATYQVKCPSCGKKTLLSNENKEKRARYNCENPTCKKYKEKEGLIKPKNTERLGRTRLKRIHECEFCGERKKHVITEDERNEIKKHVNRIEDKVENKEKRPPSNTKIPLNWDRQHEDYLEEKNITHFSDFFTKRNLFLNYLLRDKIEDYRESSEVYKLLRFIHSDSLRRTNVMTFTNENWNSGRPNAWAKHAYWIPSQFCEVDVRKAFMKSYKRIKKAIEFNKEKNYTLKKGKCISDILQGKSNFFVKTASIEELNLPRKSIDHIITDPPYGSNVQYLELSHFWYVWNKDMYDVNEPEFEKEAVANRKRSREGSKTYIDYENELKSIFDECYRVLKSDGNLVFTFNNKDLKAWLAVLFAVFRAGFTLSPGEIIFQDGVKEYEHTAHTKAEGSPYGDFIYVFEKQNNKDLRKFNDEGIQNFEKLKEDIENKYAKCLDEYVDSSGKKRNRILLDFFLEIVPKIESFVKGGHLSDREKIYDNVNKTFYKKIYEKKDK